MKQIRDILAVLDLRLWPFNQHKNIASVHVLVDGQTVMRKQSGIIKSIKQRLNVLGVYYFTIQQEVVRTSFVLAEGAVDGEGTGIEAFGVDGHNSR